MIEEFVGRHVVVDLRSPFVCLGTLSGLDDRHLDLRHADLHDLRDTDTTRENYVAQSRETIGWEPSTPLDVGLARTVEWFRTHRRDGEV